MSRTTVFTDVPKLEVFCQEYKNRYGTNDASTDDTFICLQIDSSTNSVTLHSISRDYLGLIRDVIDEFLKSEDKLPRVSRKIKIEPGPQ